MYCLYLFSNNVELIFLFFEILRHNLLKTELYVQNSDQIGNSKRHVPNSDEIANSNLHVPNSDQIGNF